MIAAAEVCTMPGCMDPARWVHGIPVQDQDGKDVFPWRLCDCCHESVLAADALLHGGEALMAGLKDPDAVFWMIEAGRVFNQVRKKLETKS